MKNLAWWLFYHGYLFPFHSNTKTLILWSSCTYYRPQGGGGPTPGQTSPPGQTPPRKTHLQDGHWSGRYASYWNAFLWSQISFQLYLKHPSHCCQRLSFPAPGMHRWMHVSTPVFPWHLPGTAVHHFHDNLELYPTFNTEIIAVVLRIFCLKIPKICKCKLNTNLWIFTNWACVMQRVTIIIIYQIRVILH